MITPEQYKRHVRINKLILGIAALLLSGLAGFLYESVPFASGFHSCIILQMILFIAFKRNETL